MEGVSHVVDDILKGLVVVVTHFECLLTLSPSSTKQLRHQTIDRDVLLEFEDGVVYLLEGSIGLYKSGIGFLLLFGGL